MGILTATGMFLNSLLRPFGVEVHRRHAWDRARRSTYPGGLDHLKNQGFGPKTVIDIGVAKGTPPLYEAFPEARHVLMEPLEEARPFLESIVSKLVNAEYIVAAAARDPGHVIINVHPDMARSSLYWECEYDAASVIRREVPAVTLDQVKHEKQLAPPILLKIDVQGAELDVLAGGPETLRDTECVILETSLFEFFRGAPLIGEVIEHMSHQGFVIYDVWALQYRSHDGALTMLDLAFVKANGRFRRMHRFHPE